MLFLAASSALSHAAASSDPSEFAAMGIQHSKPLLENNQRTQHIGERTRTSSQEGCAACAGNLGMRRVSANLSCEKQFPPTDDLISGSTESSNGSPDLVDIVSNHNHKEQRPDCSGAADKNIIGCIPNSSGGPIPLLCFARSGGWLFHPNSIKNAQEPVLIDMDDSLPPAVPSSVLVQRSQQQHRGQGRRQTTTITLPVKCPSRKPSTRSRHHRNHDPIDQSHRNSSLDASYNDYYEDQSEHLQHVYDMRTWDMYIRITEARKKRGPVPNKYEYHPPQQQSQNSMVTTGDSNPGLPPFQLQTPQYSGYFSDDVDQSVAPLELASMSGHEMIFGDLE